MALLEVEGIRKSFRRRTVVNSVSFSVGEGEIVGLLGPNGAGKTTTFRMTVGMIAPDDGKVSLDDHDVTYLPMFQRARLGMGYLSQEPSLFQRLRSLRVGTKFSNSEGSVPRVFRAPRGRSCTHG